MPRITQRRPTALLATLLLRGALLRTSLGHATLSYPLTAAVLQGPQNGLALKGTLKRAIDRVSGYITGRL